MGISGITRGFLFVFFTMYAFMPGPAGAGDADKYAALKGVWVSTAEYKGTAAAYIFKADGEFESYLYHDRNEVFTEKPASVVWSAHGTYNAEYDVLVLSIKGTSDNMPAHSSSFHLVKLTATEMVLLNTVVSLPKKMITYTRLGSARGNRK